MLDFELGGIRRGMRLCEDWFFHDRRAGVVDRLGSCGWSSMAGLRCARHLVLQNGIGVRSLADRRKGQSEKGSWMGLKI
jgi:hypothetical protein